MSFIRPPAVAGQFYPNNPSELSSAIITLLKNSKVKIDTSPKAIIAPHAGLIYSGPIAASAYVQIQAAKNIIKRVVILGPCHRVPVNGLALCSAKAFQTPLGNIEIDAKSQARIINEPTVHISDKAHEQEHSIEVHLPFLQSILSDFKLIPIVVGSSTPKNVSNVLNILWGGPETLIVVSSDLSHYLTYESAKEIDRATCTAIEQLNPAGIQREGACGRFPLGGLLHIAKRLGLKAETLDVRNSGDTAGPQNRVVGYGSWAFKETVSSSTNNSYKNKSNIEFEVENEFEIITQELLQEFGFYLLLLAEKSIDYGIKFNKPMSIKLNLLPRPLQAKGASFITLKKDNNLRGCIGSPIAHQPIAIDVMENGFKAAFNDPRFPKLEKEETEKLQISLSLLSPPQAIHFSNEKDLISKIRPKIDGLIISDKGRQSLFLPSVWSQLPDPETFLEKLKLKAGLGAAHWSPLFRAQRFTACELSMHDVLKNN